MGEPAPLAAGPRAGPGIAMVAIAGGDIGSGIVLGGTSSNASTDIKSSTSEVALGRVSPVLPSSAAPGEVTGVGPDGMDSMDGERKEASCARRPSSSSIRETSPMYNSLRNANGFHKILVNHRRNTCARGRPHMFSANIA